MHHLVLLIVFASLLWMNRSDGLGQALGLAVIFSYLDVRISTWLKRH